MIKKLQGKKVIKGCLFIFIMVIVFKSILVNIQLFNAYTKSEQIWSIGIYKGEDIMDLNSIPDINNPILTAKDIIDRDAKFVADPFIINDGTIHYMFFEVLDKVSNKGVIGLAKSENLVNWTYDSIVLEEEFHLSYPYVFKYDNEYYMLPEAGTSGYLNLYKAKKFPYEWEIVSNLLRGSYSDSSIFQYDNKWWILASKKDKDGGTLYNNLHLYYSDSLLDGWTEHCKSPIVTNDPVNSRSAGRVFIENDNIIRFAQNCEKRYGESVRAFTISKLSETEYEENLLCEVLDGSGIKGSWNEGGMHQIDVHKNGEEGFIAVVDGDYTNRYNIILENYKAKFRNLIGSEK